MSPAGGQGTIVMSPNNQVMANNFTNVNSSFNE